FRLINHNLALTAAGGKQAHQRTLTVNQAAKSEPPAAAGNEHIAVDAARGVFHGKLAQPQLVARPVFALRAFNRKAEEGAVPAQIRWQNCVTRSLQRLRSA